MIAANSQVLTREFEGEAVLLDAESGSYFGLKSPVAVWVWKRLSDAGPLTQQALLAELVHEFEVEPDRAERDLAAFLDSLRAHGLVRIEQRPPPRS